MPLHGSVPCVKCQQPIPFTATKSGGDLVDGFGGCKLPEFWDLELDMAGKNYNECPSCHHEYGEDDSHDLDNLLTAANTRANQLEEEHE